MSDSGVDFNPEDFLGAKFCVCLKIAIANYIGRPHKAKFGNSSSRNYQESFKNTTHD